MCHTILAQGVNSSVCFWKYCSVAYDLLYCVKENQHAPLFVHFSFSAIKIFVPEFSTPMRASLQILYTGAP